MAAEGQSGSAEKEAALLAESSPASRLGKPVSIVKTSLSVASQEVEDGSARYTDRFRRRYPDKDMGYTDKDRAAAMAAGSRDIKVSLQVKKKREKTHDEPEQREFKIRLAMAEQNLLTGNYERALSFIDKALSFRPGDRECTVVRARCYLGLGLNDKALQDADTALRQDCRYAKGLHVKAEILYTMGDFEHALVYFHRGQKLRPDMEVFRLGIQKAQEAIENAVGGSVTDPLTVEKVQKMNVKPEAPRWTDYMEPGSSEDGSSSRTSSRGKSAKPLSTVNESQSNKLMGELTADIEYLEKLANCPGLTKLNSPACRHVRQEAREALQFLNSRKEFWMQQRPYTWNECRTARSIR